MPEWLLVSLVFIAVYVYTWPIIVFVFFCGFMLEANDRYISTVFLTALMLFLVWNFFALAVTIPYIWVGFIIYPIVGFAFAPYRWFRHAERKVRENNLRPMAPDDDERKRDDARHGTRYRRDIEHMRPEIDFRNQLDRIACWVLAWPIVAIECFIGDLYREIQRIITTFFGRLYTNLTERALRLVDFPEIEDTDSGGC